MPSSVEKYVNLMELNNNLYYVSIQDSDIIVQIVAREFIYYGETKANRGKPIGLFLGINTCDCFTRTKQTLSLVHT